MIKNILYDLDGVLVDAQEWHYHALNLALHDTCNYEIAREDHVKRFDGLPTLRKLSILSEEGRCKPEQFEAIFRLKQHYTLRLIKSHCKPDPVKVDMLYRFRKDYRLGCVTNSIAQTAYEMLVHAGLNYYLEYVQGNEAVANAKPNPAPYLHAMAHLGIYPQETLIVEDSDKGAESAWASGAHVLRIFSYKDLTYDLVAKFIEGVQ